MEHERGCQGQVGLFIGVFVYLHNWSVKTQDAYLWVFESSIILVLESPKYHSCARTLKHVSFFFLSVFFPVFYLLFHLPFYFPFFLFLQLCLFSQITKFKCKKVLSVSDWESSQEFNRKLSRCYFRCLNKWVDTEIQTIQLNSILRQKEKMF